MTRQQAIDLYKRGRTPEVADLEGTWQVRMWRWWRFMRRDRKVINGNTGHNVYYLCFIPVRWGGFKVEKERDRLTLVYDNGVVIDYLRLHPHNRDIMIGQFNKTVGGRTIVSKEPFTLTRR